MSGRVIVLLLPQWQVAAAASQRGDPSTILRGPVAVVRGNNVVGVSEAARADGVVSTLRIREAQARCPDLTLLRYDEEWQLRCFGSILDLLEEYVPEVEGMSPGRCAIPARGPARYYGGEQTAAEHLAAELVVRSSLARASGVRIGVADDLFTAGVAAEYGGLPEGSSRHDEEERKTAVPPSPVTVVPSGGSRSFLAPLPVEILPNSEIVSLLERLGVRTLGGFAALDSAGVSSRLGPEGEWMRRCCVGEDPRRTMPRERHEDLTVRMRFDDPVERADQLAFAMRGRIDALLSALLAARRVCTSVRVELVDDLGGRSSRIWNHPRCFDAAGIVDRVRWQLQSCGAALSAGVVEAVISPERVDESYRYERALFSDGVEDRVVQGMARVESMVGHGGALTARLSGGRRLRERVMLIPWGDVPEQSSADGPWPGRMPPPAPAVVFAHPWNALVLDLSDIAVTLDTRGALTSEPARIILRGEEEGHSVRVERDLLAWAGPWPLTPRWWDASMRPSAGVLQESRFQAVDAESFGWLLVFRDGRWWAEARYE